MQEFFDSEIFIYIVRPVIYVGFAYIFYKILTYFLNKALNNKHLNNKNKKRVNTTLSLLNKSII